MVTVGRFTSPDTMVRMVKAGITDLIGAARPSIADPFLPRKIEEGRPEDIRECIGCNVCYSGDSLSVPIRCTQNPTMGEEWRQGWHPERIRAAGSDGQVLIVGAGPAGLDAAHICIATGARWRRDLFTGKRFAPVADPQTRVLTPDDIMDGLLPTGPTVVYDADGYYMGGVIAERLRAAGLEVTLVTPHDRVSHWTEHTGEGWRVPGHLIGLGVTLVTAHGLSWFDGQAATLACTHSCRERKLEL